MMPSWFRYVVGCVEGLVKAMDDKAAVQKVQEYYSEPDHKDIKIEVIDESVYGGRVNLDTIGRQGFIN